jgi:hypothetical protein
MKGIHNAYARFSVAVDNLATSPKSLKDRLFSAAMVILNDMSAEDLPIGDLRSEYKELDVVLTRLPHELPTEGSLAATVRAMTDVEAQEIARRIVTLEREISEEHWRRRSKRRAASGVSRT